MKRESTEQTLASALESILDEGVPLEKVTVSAICARCEASKTTFYNHFRDKYDLMVWYLKRDIVAALDGFDDIGTWMATGTEMARAIAVKAEYYRAVLDYDGQNSFVAYLQENNTASFRTSLKKATGLDPLPRDYEYAIRAFMAGSHALLSDWIRGGCAEPPEGVMRIIRDTAPRSLAFYFTESAS